MPRTTIRVRNKPWEYFQKECQALFLRRDAYLNHVLPGELSILEDMPPCDEAGRSWLKQSWMGKGGLLRDKETTPVAVTLDQDVLARLNKACDDKCVPRDAFFNCVLDFITTRLYEPAVVIKNPRTGKDVASQLADLLTDEEMNENEVRFHLFEIAKEWGNARNITRLRRDYYRYQLYYNEARVNDEKEFLDIRLDSPIANAQEGVLS